MIFQDLNSATKHYAKKLLDSSSVQTTNPINAGRYKNKLGGEIIQEFFKIENSQAVIGTWKNHKLYKWWMYSEILSEMLNLDPPLAYKYRPELLDQHYDVLEDGTMQYTYSSRWVEFHQLLNIYKKLKDNPNSKRAVVAIYCPYDTSPNRVDSPCTLGYQFLYRDRKLNLTTSFRSHDFMSGFKYDHALSSFVLQSFCSWLGMSPGTLGIYENSLHFYNRDRSILEDLVNETQHVEKQSDELIVDGNLGIKEFYEQLRKVKSSEEASFNQNFEQAEILRDELTSELFKRMCNVYLQRNKK